jgi:hypothetical protein
MFVGYSLDYTADCYEMWDPATSRVHQTRDVIWLNRMYYNRVEPTNNMVVEPDMEPVIVYHTHIPEANGPGEGDNHQEEVIDEFAISMMIMWSITYRMNSLMQRQNKWEIHLVELMYRLQAPPTTFKAYICRLQQWEQDLFSTNLRFHTSPMAVMELLHPTEPNDSDSNCTLYFEEESTPTSAIGGNLVSDGSERAPMMAFGWSLGTTYGKRLTTCEGPGFSPSSSHHVEGTGMLSGVKCL